MHKTAIYISFALFLVLATVVYAQEVETLVPEQQTVVTSEDIIYGKEPTGALELKKEYKVNSDFERLQLEKLDKIISLLQSLRKLQQN